MPLHATRRRLLTAIGLAGTAGTALVSPGRPPGSPALDATVPAGAWPVAGRDPARTKHAPDAAPPTADARIAWSASAPLSFWNRTVTVDADTVYAATHTGAIALDASDGTVRWRFDTGDHWPPDGIQPRVGPLVAGDRVLLVTDAAVLALDADTGRVRWARENVRGGVRNAVLLGDALFVPNNQDGPEIVAVDVETGGVWHRFGLEDYQSPAAFVDGGLVAFGPDALARLDPRTGERVWRSGEPPAHDLRNAAFAGTDDVVVVGSNPLVAVDTADGTEAWRYEAPTGEDEVERFRPATDGNRVYVSAYWARETIAFDAVTGDVLWRIPERLGEPVVADGTVYCADGDGITALDAATGERRGRFGDEFLPPDASETPTVAGDRFYVTIVPDEDAGAEPTLFALEPV